MTPEGLFVLGIYLAIFWLIFFAVMFLFAILSGEGGFVAVGFIGVWFGLPISVAICWLGALVLAIIQALG